jgi:protein ImuA
MTDKRPAPEDLHPSVWRASQIARGTTRCVETGHDVLSRQLPGEGWPTATLIDLLIQQPGIGEMRVLAPALKSVSAKGIVLLQPPHPPQAISLAAMGIPPEKLLWVKPGKTADALWSAEQVLKSGSAGALLFWASHIRNESLRRLHLAAQSSETLFFVMRPLSATLDASPAPLRLSLKPADGGVEIGFVKRRGPQRDATLFLPLTVSTVVRRTAVPSLPNKEAVEAKYLDEEAGRNTHPLPVGAGF